MQTSTITEKLIASEVYTSQDLLVNTLFESQMFSFGDIANLYDENEEPQEIMQWVAVSEWLGGKLREQGEPVLDNAMGTWWGRTTYGQQFSQDAVMNNIAQTL